MDTGEMVETVKMAVEAYDKAIKLACSFLFKFAYGCPIVWTSENSDREWKMAARKQKWQTVRRAKTGQP